MLIGGIGEMFRRIFASELRQVCHQRCFIKPLVRLPMSRSDIADYLGLTKETVSRVVSAFRRDRLIRLKAVDEIEIINSAGLEQLAECIEF
jgi:CRP-like cAMP-binding protein